MLRATAQRIVRCSVSLRLLDIGCGSGRDLALLVSFGHDCFGLDATPEFAFERAKSGQFPVPLNIEIHTGSEDWQSCSNSIALGEMSGIKVNVVEGVGHGLPKAYVGKLLDDWNNKSAMG